MPTSCGGGAEGTGVTTGGDGEGGEGVGTLTGTGVGAGATAGAGAIATGEGLGLWLGVGLGLGLESSRGAGAAAVGAGAGVLAAGLVSALGDGVPLDDGPGPPPGDAVLFAAQTEAVVGAVARHACATDPASPAVRRPQGKLFPSSG